MVQFRAPDIAGAFGQGFDAAQRNRLADVASQRADNMLALQQRGQEFREMDANRDYEFRLEAREFNRQRMAEAERRANEARANAARRGILDANRDAALRLTTLMYGAEPEMRQKIYGRALERFEAAGMDPAQMGFGAEVPSDEDLMLSITELGGEVPQPARPEYGFTNVDGTLVRTDKTSGTAEPVFAPERGPEVPDLGDLNTLRDDLRTELSDFGVVADGYTTIQELAGLGTGVSDTALLVAYTKILDPGSVAREGEVAAVQSNVGRLVERFGQQVRNALTGEGSLPGATRQDIINAATEIYRRRREGAERTLGGYRAISERTGLPFGDIFPRGQLSGPALDTLPPPPSASLSREGASGAGAVTLPSGEIVNVGEVIEIDGVRYTLGEDGMFIDERGRKFAPGR